MTKGCRQKKAPVFADKRGSYLIPADRRAVEQQAPTAGALSYLIAPNSGRPYPWRCLSVCLPFNSKDAPLRQDETFMTFLLHCEREQRKPLDSNCVQPKRKHIGRLLLIGGAKGTSRVFCEASTQQCCPFLGSHF